MESATALSNGKEKIENMKIITASLVPSPEMLNGTKSERAIIGKIAIIA